MPSKYLAVSKKNVKKLENDLKKLHKRANDLAKRKLITPTLLTVLVDIDNTKTDLKNMKKALKKKK